MQCSVSLLRSSPTLQTLQTLPPPPDHSPLFASIRWPGQAGLTSAGSVAAGSDGCLLGRIHFPCGYVVVTLDRIYGKKEAGTGEHLNTFNQINKHNRNAAAPHGRLPQTKHKLKSRPGPLSSSNVVTPPFIPSEAPPWDSRLVSGAGVVHYHSLHRPRSVPTALGPAPLVTYPHRPSQAGGYSRDCALLPPSPLSRGEPVRAAAAYLGVRTDEARERRRKDEE